MLRFSSKQDLQQPLVQDSNNWQPQSSLDPSWQKLQNVQTNPPGPTQQSPLRQRLNSPRFTGPDLTSEDPKNKDKKKLFLAVQGFTLKSSARNWR